MSQAAVPFGVELHALAQGNKIVWRLRADEQGEACNETDASSNGDEGNGVG